MADILEIVRSINDTLPVHSMWDGFWVQSFKRKTLIISCSFDSIYYREFDLIFKKVIFFNVPENWRDTAVIGDEMIRIATVDEFGKYQEGFDTRGLTIFAIDLHFRHHGTDSSKMHTFFIVAEHIYLVKCLPGNNNPAPEYVDSFGDEEFPCMKNRVLG